MGAFQPRYIFQTELDQYGLLPSNSALIPKILNLVDTASTAIDEHCGRVDGDGNGSLVYTTYQERILSQSPNTNIIFLPHRPLVALTQAQVNTLQAQDVAASGFYYTGVLPSINTLANGTLSAIVAASGRYVPGRRDRYGFGDEPNSYLNPLNTITLFGGPPTWQPIDMVNLDYDPKTGEAWFSSGMYLARYSEIVVTYNSGFDPANMPKAVKRACAMIVKNLLAKGTTGMKSLNSSKVGVAAEFDEDLFDINVQKLLSNYVTSRMI